nr:D-alanyl-D-alanine carboxypeptidase family protein [Specibacter cremeus]
MQWWPGRVAVVPAQASIAVVVDKLRPNRPVNNVPPDLRQVGNQSMRLEAANQLAAFIGAASRSGVGVTTVSGYRSYATQVNVYNSYVAAYGRAYADTISARLQRAPDGAGHGHRQPEW